MTETMAAFLVAMALYLMVVSESQSGSWLVYTAGLVLGLGMLCRTTIWAFAIASAVIGACLRRADGRRDFQWASTVLVVALLVQAPWFLRNWFAFRHVIPTTTHGGYTLLLGNNDSYYDDVIRRAPFSAWSSGRLGAWQAELNIRAALDGATNEVTRDAYCYRVARQTIAARPLDFACAVLVRLVSFWRVTPHANAAYGSMVRLGCALFYVPEFAFMLVGICNRKAFQWPFVLCLVPLISFTLVHSIYWSDMRMRAPVIPAVAVLAAIGAERVVAYTRCHRKI
jgi:4-amino-4-deoxy-L-arabinose transferase-like glycosyltransferase